MLDQIRARIEDEIERLTEELTRDLPARIKTAMEHGDLRENAEFKAAKERQAFVEARLNHLTTRMTELSKIDVTQMAYDFIDLDAGQVSLASPIGRGLLGAKPGQEVTIALPRGERRYKVVQLTTLPQQLEGTE
jgi:transcription elongation factor GreA